MAAGGNAIPVPDQLNAQVLNIDNEFWIFGYGYIHFMMIASPMYIKLYTHG